ncbi:hypothetical protein CERSUDRAFT_46377 [Gelatoporia subvermispora B]|uniref:BTB domain-containing protein n=1 Tax=Ceriporiopsis subvermispora (strain B) TaxID=914234 RepID=M2RM66_CERS8|nr:hypothetical protein CERSUDRAFT_46377 [Gelatoporia subvermispora B]
MYERGEPWFDDGNIILLTGQEEGTVAFKVHRGVLARHSEVFQSMFEIPQSQACVEMLENCPVVRMHDRPTEFSTLIRALYDGARFQDRDAADFFYTAGILRLATKYFINHLRMQAIRHLAQTWSHSLRGHDEMLERALNHSSASKNTYPHVHPLHVLNLARETNVRVIVPSVLYFLSGYPLADILRGDHQKLRIKHPSRPSSQLAPEDIQDYTLMYQHRLQITLDFIRDQCRGREQAHAEEVAPPNCQKEFARLSNQLYQFWTLRTGPLHYMVQAVELAMAEDSRICTRCRRAFRDEVIALREKIWQELPQIVGLPSWETLVKSDLEST